MGQREYGEREVNFAMKCNDFLHIKMNPKHYAEWTHTATNTDFITGGPCFINLEVLEPKRSLS